MVTSVVQLCLLRPPRRHASHAINVVLKPREVNGGHMHSLRLSVARYAWNQ